MDMETVQILTVQIQMIQVIMMNRKIMMKRKRKLKKNQPKKMMTMVLKIIPRIQKMMMIMMKIPKIWKKQRKPKEVLIRLTPLEKSLQTMKKNKKKSIIMMISHKTPKQSQSKRQHQSQNQKKKDHLSTLMKSIIKSLKSQKEMVKLMTWVNSNILTMQMIRLKMKVRAAVNCISLLERVQAGDF